MRLEHFEDENYYLNPELFEQESKVTLVSGYTAGKAYNEICKVIAGRWPDAVLEEEAPFAHEFFMKLFGVIPNE